MAGEGSEKVMFRGLKRQIFVEEPYGPEAIAFYKIVFGATELCSLTKTISTSDKIKGSTKFESCELSFGPSSVIVSERNPDSSLVKKSSAGTRIQLEFEEIDSIVADAEELGAVIVRGQRGRRQKTHELLKAGIDDPSDVLLKAEIHDP